MGDVRNTLDRLYYKVGSYAGWCSANVGNVDELLEQGEKYTSDAVFVSTFVGQNSEVAKKLSAAADAIGKVRGQVGSVKNLCVSAGKLAELGAAIAVLNAWTATRTGVSNEGVGNKEAAKAFDKLFGVAGYFAAKLPPPLNAYAKVLDQIGISQFFENVRDLMDPESPNTPRGRMLHRVMTEQL